MKQDTLPLAPFLPPTFLAMAATAFLTLVFQAGTQEWRAAMAQEPQTDLVAGVEDLGWLEGSWSLTAGDGYFQEVWTAPRGNNILGMNRTVRRDRLSDFEYLRIESRDGDIYYLASPGGRQPATPFKLVELEDQRAVFENPEHDFPMRIAYGREGTMLTATISGTIDGLDVERSWTWELETDE